MVNIVCSGPGPHIPANGVLGTADHVITGMLCQSTACQADSAAAQAASVAADANRVSIQQSALGALTTNRAYSNLASPTAAQTTAEVKALAQQVNGVIRLLLNQLDATN